MKYRGHGRPFSEITIFQRENSSAGWENTRTSKGWHLFQHQRLSLKLLGIEASAEPCFALADELIQVKPLPEYPRPQMVRDQWMNLNGEWDFLGDGPVSPVMPEAFSEKVCRCFFLL